MGNFRLKHRSLKHRSLLYLSMVILVDVLFFCSLNGIGTPSVAFRNNVVLIQNEDWFWHTPELNSVLENNLPGVVSNLDKNHFSTAIIFIGNIYPNGSIVQERSDSQLQSAIDAFHNRGIRVYLWVENNGFPPNIDANHRDAIYSQIKAILNNVGADGYFDDIENDQIPSDSSYRQVWLDFENNGSIALHTIGKSWTVAYGIDWVTNINSYLNVDTIYTMFYSEGISSFEDSANIDGFWQENFGVGAFSGFVPASPVVPIVMVNGFEGEKPLSFQLNEISCLLNAYGSWSRIDGVGVWLYETTTNQDWQTLGDFNLNPLGLER